MNIHPDALSLRTKKLGVLMCDARLAARKSLEECASALGIPTAELEACEYGDSALTLPQIEVLALYLKVPLDHFWGSKALSEDPDGGLRLDLEQLVALRQRVIGAMLRQARVRLESSPDEVAQDAGLTGAQLEAAELGELSLTLPQLEALAAALNRPINEFIDKHGPVGAWMNQQRVMDGILKLPPELQNFVSKPINRPYLDLALRLSEMSVDKLRGVGEGILEITL
ncbi:MAG: helix-turn-helix transcriptional regulator [Chloroflexi bacterium]|nr:helix-turn-helix transcriptional regulator [Chloroflexota bacterium]